MIATACPNPFASCGKSFAWVAPSMAPSRTALRSTTLGRAHPHACSGRSLRLLAADQLPERGFVADRIQVGVVLRGIAKLLRHLDRVPEVIERVTRPAALTLAAGEVEEQHGVLRSGCDQGAETVGDLGVLTRLIKGGERSPQFPAAGLVRFPRRAFQRDDGRPGLLGGGRSLGAGRGEHESSGWRVDPVTVKLEHRVAAQHEKEFLVSGGVILVVLVYDEVTHSTGRPSSHSERRDAQVVSDRPIVTACVRKFLDLVQMRNRVTSHGPTHRRRPPRRNQQAPGLRPVEVSSLTGQTGDELLGSPDAAARGLRGTRLAISWRAGRRTGSTGSAACP